MGKKGGRSLQATGACWPEAGQTGPSSQALWALSQCSQSHRWLDTQGRLAGRGQSAPACPAARRVRAPGGGPQRPRAGCASPPRARAGPAAERPPGPPAALRRPRGPHSLTHLAGQKHVRGCRLDGLRRGLGKGEGQRSAGRHAAGSSWPASSSPHRLHLEHFGSTGQQAAASAHAAACTRAAACLGWRREQAQQWVFEMACTPWSEKASRSQTSAAAASSAGSPRRLHTSTSSRTLLRHGVLSPMPARGGAPAAQGRAAAPLAPTGAWRTPCCKQMSKGYPGVCQSRKGGTLSCSGSSPRSQEPTPGRTQTATAALPEPPINTAAAPLLAPHPLRAPADAAQQRLPGCEELDGKQGFSLLSPDRYGPAGSPWP